MSKLLDYLKVVKAGIENGDKVIESIWIASQVRNKHASPEAVAEIMMRKEICAKCPFNSKNAVANKTYTTNLDYDHCIFCLCKVGSEDGGKEYCLSCKCGISEFNKKHPDKEMPLKWGPFDKEKNESVKNQSNE